MNGVSGSSVARGAQTAEEPHRDPQLAFSRLGINIAVERYEEGCANSQNEDDISQRVDRARVAHDPPPQLVILAVILSRVQRGQWPTRRAAARRREAWPATYNDQPGAARCRTCVGSK
jgi:hypothetical protein